MVRASKTNNKRMFETQASVGSAEYRKQYLAWQEHMYYDEGYTTSILDIMDRLGVSRTWIHNVLNEDLSFVQYSADFLHQLTDVDDIYGGECASTGYIYYNGRQLSRWLVEHSEFTVQTMIEEAGDCELGKNKEVNRFLKGIPINDNKRAISPEKIGPKIAQYKELARYCKHDIVCDRKRNIFAEISFTPFDYWNDATIFFSAEQVKEQHPNYLRFVGVVAPARLNRDGNTIIPTVQANNKDEDLGLDYEFIRRSTEMVARMAFHLSLVKIHLKSGKARGKVFYAYVPGYRDLKNERYRMPILVSADPTKHEEIIPYFAACLEANSILSEDETEGRNLSYPKPVTSSQRGF